jgi:5-methylcytosine-specific restriction endonuclease McrA
MAAGDYQRLAAACHCGQPVKLWSGLGRKPKYCEEHGGKAREPAGTAACLQCGAAYTARKGKLYCSHRCAYRARDGSLRTAEEHRAWLRAKSAASFTCEHCGQDAYRRISGSNKKNGFRNRWCSMACKMARAAMVRKEVEFLHRLAARHRAAERAARPRIPSYILGITYVPPVRTCAACGCQWSAITRVGPMRYCPTPECQATQRRLARRRAGKTHVGRAKRLGRRYGYFNVLLVFERDRWTCQLCGRKTPQHLRGTLDPLAPELDHILPLAAGGDHVIENCQCACRECNGAKAARPAGQLWLAGFADLR